MEEQSVWMVGSNKCEKENCTFFSIISSLMLHSIILRKKTISNTEKWKWMVIQDGLQVRNSDKIYQVIGQCRITAVWRCTNMNNYLTAVNSFVLYVMRVMLWKVLKCQHCSQQQSFTFEKLKLGLGDVSQIGNDGILIPLRCLGCAGEHSMQQLDSPTNRQKLKVVHRNINVSDFSFGWAVQLPINFLLINYIINCLAVSSL